MPRIFVNIELSLLPALQQTLDVLVNYDIKYRMSQEPGEEE